MNWRKLWLWHLGKVAFATYLIWWGGTNSLWLSVPCALVILFPRPDWPMLAAWFKQRGVKSSTASEATEGTGIGRTAPLFGVKLGR